jgi:selenide,water dikinase
LARGIESSLHSDNVAALAAVDPSSRGHPLAPLLIDPQTAGGLLAGLAPDRAERCLAELRRLGYRAAIIGRVLSASAGAAQITFEPGAAEIVAEPVALS